ncbi:MAG: DUF4388 domain-containing protein [Polyangiaceae bacterium]|nr:DUF4388 domain-containing protein [Polyangiaceae bacterium]
MNRPSAPEENISANAENASPFSVADYVQLAGMAGRSVVLDVHGSVAGRGRIVIQAGMVWTARDEHGTGFDAFRRMVHLSDATVQCLAPDAQDLAEPRMFQLSCENALLNAARMNDEAEEEVRRSSPSFVPGASSAPSDIEREWERLASVRPPAESTVKAKLSVVPAPSSVQRPGPPPMPAQRPNSRGLHLAEAQTAKVADVQSTKTFDELYDEGIDAILRRRFEDALRAFNEANVVRPGDPCVRANLERLAQMGYSS